MRIYRGMLDFNAQTKVRYHDLLQVLLDMLTLDLAFATTHVI
jgi:hypothetical protein